jgi:catalase
MNTSRIRRDAGYLSTQHIRSAVVAQLARIDHELATQVVAKLGLPEPPNQTVDDTVPASLAPS